MFLILKSEMLKKGVTTKDIASVMGLTERSVRSRLNGAISWRWPEMRLIKNSFFKDFSIEYLFSDDAEHPDQQGA